MHVLPYARATVVFSHTCDFCHRQVHRALELLQPHSRARGPHLFWICEHCYDSMAGLLFDKTAKGKCFYKGKIRDFISEEAMKHGEAANSGGGTAGNPAAQGATTSS